MKIIRFFMVIGASALIITGCNKPGSVDVKLTSGVDSLSYAIGVNVAQQLKNEGVKNLNAAAFAKGIQDVKDSSKLLIDETDMFIRTYLAQENARKNKELYGKNIDEGKKFLAENKTKDGVVELPSGLQYKIIKQGTGVKPQATDMVKVHYHGTLLNGTVFDSSIERKEPAQFPVNGVISGWTEALQLMPVGSKWQLFLPYNLAYGERGAQGSPIEPYATLVFDVELLEIVKQDPNMPAGHGPNDGHNH